MYYWLIIGTASSVRIFMCIHMGPHSHEYTCSACWQCCYEFDTSRTGAELVQFRWYVSSHEQPNLFMESCEFTWIEPVELVNSLTEHVKSRVIVCWVDWSRIALLAAYLGNLILNWPKLSRPFKTVFSPYNRCVSVHNVILHHFR